MLSQNAVVFLRLALGPTGRKLRKQLDLPLKSQPPTILRLDSVSQLVSECQLARDALEDAVKQLVEVAGGKSLPLLPAFDNYKMVAPPINLDAWACAILSAPISR